MINKKLNKILRYPEKIPCDKRMHFMIGVVLVSILTIFTTNVFIVTPMLLIFAWGIEYFQKLTYSGTFENLDAVAVLIGGEIVYLSHILREEFLWGY